MTPDPRRAPTTEPPSLVDRRVEAGTERLLMSHPSWFKRLSFVRNRDSEEARYAARTLVEAVLRAADEVTE